MYETTPRDLGSNKFTGSIEALGKLTKLSTLCVRADLGNIYAACCFALQMRTFGDVGLRLSLCERIRPSCAHTALRSLDSNQFTGSVNALGKLTKLTYLCVRAGISKVDRWRCVSTFAHLAHTLHSGIFALTRSLEVSRPSASLPS